MTAADDATTGRLTHRRVLAIALPIVLSNATIPILGAVDTGVIGQMGLAEPIGAVGIGAVILTSIYWVFGFLRMGTSGLVAQARGAHDPGLVGAHLVRALTVALGIGAVIILLHVPLMAVAFHFAPASVGVEEMARQYLSIRFWGAPATIGMYALTGWMIAAERTRDVLIVQLVVNILNIGLDLWFVLGLGWGVPGVASATLIAEITGFLFALCLARKPIRLGLQQAHLFARGELVRMAQVNTDIMLRTLMLLTFPLSFMFLSAAQGDVTLAANQVLNQFIALTAFALDGFAFAAESLVGQAIGAKRPDQVRRAAWLSSLWGVIGSIVMMLVFAVFGGAIIDLLTTAPDVRDEARRYLPYLIAAPVVSIAAWMLDGIFIGATLTRDMRNAMALAVLCYALALAILPPIMGEAGLWAALLILNTSRAIFMWRRYPRVEAAARG